MIGVKYFREDPAVHVDNLYGTGLSWAVGQTHNVSLGVAAKMLQHTDTYAESEAVPGETVPIAQVNGEESDLKPLPNLAGMDGTALRAFAQQHYGEKLHHKMSVEKMRTKILGIIQERGR